MMDWSLDGNEYDDDRNRKKGLWISLFLHALLFLLCLIPFAEEVPRTNEFQGVLVVFGNPDDGANDAAQLVEEDVEAETSQFEEIPEEIEEDEQEDLEPEPTSVAPDEPIEVKETEVKVEVPSVETETVQDNSELIAAEKKAQEQKEKLAEAKAEKQKEAKERAEAEAKKEKEDAEAKAKAVKAKAAKAKADAEAAAKAAADKKAKELEEKKKQFGDLFGKGSGNDNGGGNTGDPLGDPDGEALEGISTGKGKVGGGLSNRGLIYEPEIADNSQKAGKVVVRVCVNREGQVIEAKFTQQGSTTTDRTLVEIAEKAARKYKFSANESDKQCGTVTIDFKLV